jgi:DNA polymerase III epsilon subunit-like protein
MPSRPGQELIPAVIDVEASGFGAGSYPIEVGVVLPNGRSHCYLIRPAASWSHWDPEAEAVHGIRREILESRGAEIDEVARTLNRILQGQTVYSDAWGHDRSWLARLFEEAEVSQHFRLESLRSLLTDHQLERWQSTREQVIREVGQVRHRASVDALIVQQTYLKSLPDNEAAA